MVYELESQIHWEKIVEILIHKSFELSFYSLLLDT